MKKTNNKGFSLVELIVVIAIMAVLVGVLAPQFTKYVERSRKATDVQNVAAIMTACDVYATDNPTFTGGDLTLKSAGTTSVANNPTGVEAALAAAGITSYGLKSNEWVDGTSTDLKLTVTVTDGTTSYTIAGQKSELNILTGDIDASAANNNAGSGDDDN